LFLPALAAALGLGSFCCPAADEAVKYEGQPGCKVKIEGTSTIHDWSVESQIIGGTVELDAASDADLKAMKVRPTVAVNIPVRSLKSGTKSMDSVMYEHMKQKDFPKIEYKLLELKPAAAAAGAAAAAASFEAVGALTIAGVTKTNTMPVTFDRPAAGQLKISGQAGLKMTDFGIKPPAPDIGLGFIKTGDDVKISFEWLTAKVVK
jgi:polyisoprenoid-binding protein YceI